VNPVQPFLAAFNAALTQKPITVPSPPKCEKLTDLDRERIQKAIQKNQRKEQKRNEQRQRSAAGQVPPI